MRCDPREFASTTVVVLHTCCEVAHKLKCNERLVCEWSTAADQKRAMKHWLRLPFAVLLLEPGFVHSTATLDIRGKTQTLEIYGARGGSPVVVASGDGGWIHLAPHVAEVLSSRGFFVVGLNSRAYLSSFTMTEGPLTEKNVPGDFRTVVDFAGQGSPEKPILIGVSEGAGLSVLAATGAEMRTGIAGILGLGLPDLNELAWHWRDAVIYLTRKSPNEPSFSSGSLVDRVAPLPLAAIHATNDDFVPLAEVQRVMAKARPPSRLWVIEAADHRFSNNLAEFDQRLLEALAWVRANQPRVK
jgi:fermentation-respiration switch protein FrsA (DUF1100 family)